MTGSLEALFTATIIFVGGHFLLSSQPLRRAIKGVMVSLFSFLVDVSTHRPPGAGGRQPRIPAARLGAQGFRLIYSLFAVASFAWMLLAYKAAPHMAVWSPPPAFAWVPLLVMPVALLLAVCGVTTPSPTIVGGEDKLREGVGDFTPGMLRVTRHPFLWGTALWAASHLAVRGDAASMILMGGILALSLGGIRHIDLRRETTLGAAWGPIALTTSALPFAALATGRTTMDWRGIGWWRPALALALYAVLLALHPSVIGASPLPG